MISAFLVTLLTGSASATPIDFAADVRPLLVQHCYECHGSTKQRSGLRLDVKAAAFKGGEIYGPSIHPGQPGDSPLLKLVTSSDPTERMPPTGNGLTADEQALLERWIAAGAEWPDGIDTASLVDKRDHWSFKPVAGVNQQAGSETSIDQLIDARLHEHGLERSPEAASLVWLRRVTLDLTGLPPTPAEIREFAAQLAADGSAGHREQVYAAVVERLLSSERYGERWAQHWLDVVRFADTHGFEVNTERPNAWPYRDYVIRSFNSDVPYDRFIREQIAGDALGEDAATGFLVTASVLLPDQIGADEPSKRLARQDSLDEIVMNIGQTFLGLSVGCARCHDHKFDPITARDYYAMQGFVAGVTYEDRELRTPAADAARKEIAGSRERLADVDRQLAWLAPLVGNGALRPMVTARVNTDRFSPTKARRVRFTVQATNSLEPCIDELEVFSVDGQNVALAKAGAVPRASGSSITVDRHELSFVNDGLYGNSRSWMSNQVGGGWVEVEFPEEHTIERVVWGRDREGQYTDRLPIHYVIEVADSAGEWRVVADSRDRKPFDPEQGPAQAFPTDGLSPAEMEVVNTLRGQRSRLEQQIKASESQTRIFAGRFREPDDIHLLSRGDPEQPKEPVSPAVIEALGELKLSTETAEQKRRLALADWIASPANPLTARVMANRIWQGHFGSGLVQTPSDFGWNGTRPSHPELLDWLANEFIRGGWSVKRLHRLIVLSQTYRQASTVQPRAAEVDADNRLLWRFPSRRLEAESIRDAMLAVSGRLNLQMYGRGYNLFAQRGGLSGFTPIEQLTAENQRRMIYAHKVRRETEAVFGAFDCPDAGQSTAQRRASTTPIQALNLFNSRFTIEVSAAFAERVQADVGNDLSQQIDRAYELALGRPATAAEHDDAEPIVRQYGLAVLCRALFNSNEFLFLP